MKLDHHFFSHITYVNVLKLSHNNIFVVTRRQGHDKIILIISQSVGLIIVRESNILRLQVGYVLRSETHVVEIKHHGHNNNTLL